MKRGGKGAAEIAANVTAAAMRTLLAAVVATAPWILVPQARADPPRRSPAVNTKADDGLIERAPHGARGEVELKAAPPPPRRGDDDVTDIKVLDDHRVPQLPGPPEDAVPGAAPAQAAAPTDAPPAEAPPSAAAEAAPSAAAEAAPAEGEASPPTTLPEVPEVHEKTETKAPTLLTRQEAPNKKRWETDNGGFTASRFAVLRRLSARPASLLVPRDSIPTEPRAFLWRVAFDTWRGLEALTDSENGLPIDNVHFDGRLLTPLSLRVGDYTNITNVGLQLAAIAAARRLGFILDDVAELYASRLLDTLGTLETHHGYFFNYYDTTSAEPTSSFVSFVDTSWLVAGLLITRQAFPELNSTVRELLAPIDFAFFYNQRDKLMSHGYYVNLQARSVYQYGAFYTEARLGSLIAIGKGDAPLEHWYAMRRAFRPACSEGENCPGLHELGYTARNGNRMHVHYFNWRNHRYVPSWGGSMFEALMPRLLVDEAHWAPRSLGPNGEAHAVVQEMYARDTLGLPVWGMSPAIDPDSGRYGEFGTAVLGSHAYASTVVAPYAAALALAVAPDDATANLMEMVRRYDIYGDFGFYDAVNPVSGKVAYSYLALDQAMLFLAVANHLTGGYLQDLFEADAFVRPALPLLSEERFFR